MKKRRRFRIHPVLGLIYVAIKGLAWSAMHIYYRRRIVLGREHTRTEAPYILISNHPSTLMDVLNVGIHVPILFFLANYSLFKHPVSNWLLSRLYCIPIKRREDVDAGEDRNNDAAFEQSFQHLEKGGLLYIAPEGNSWMERRVRAFKTGTARIAFQTEARNNFDLGLTILPAGLTYYAPEKFRSDLVVQFGAPVVVKDFEQDWKKDPDAAVDQLTALLEERVKALCIHSKDEGEEAFLKRLEAIWSVREPMPLEQSFHRSRAWSQTLLRDDALCDETADYFGQLTEAGLTHRGVELARQPGAKARHWVEAIFLLLAFPLFAVGYIFWWLPCYLPAALARRMKLYVGYDSNVKTLAGIFTFPIAWWLLYRAGCHWLPQYWQALLLIPASMLAGLFTEQYIDLFQRWNERRKAMGN
jgi:glycerol-3-phosphate O-acyltransferase / dihydroxyacetone phosphate acyltransferase